VEGVENPSEKRQFCNSPSILNGDRESGRPNQADEGSLASWLEDRTFWDLYASNMSFASIHHSLATDFNAFLLLIPVSIALHFTVKSAESVVFVCGFSRMKLFPQ